MFIESLVESAVRRFILEEKFILFSLVISIATTFTRFFLLRSCSKIIHSANIFRGFRQWRKKDPIFEFQCLQKVITQREIILIAPKNRVGKNTSFSASPISINIIKLFFYLYTTLYHYSVGMISVFSVE